MPKLHYDFLPRPAIVWLSIGILEVHWYRRFLSPYSFQFTLNKCAFFDWTVNRGKITFLTREFYDLDIAGINFLKNFPVSVVLGEFGIELRIGVNCIPRTY